MSAHSPDAFQLITASIAGLALGPRKIWFILNVSLFEISIIKNIALYLIFGQEC